MIYIFLSICCSVAVSVLLKLARRYNIDIYQAIAWNYSMAILLTLVFFRPHLGNLPHLSVGIYSTLGVLFPALFVVIGLAVKYAGIVRTDIAQRLSLFISLIAAFLLFNEQATPLKLIGISIGIIAVLCSIPWQKNDPANRRSAYSWLYLVVVFVGMGVIDVLLKKVSAIPNVPYTTSLFLIFTLAFVVSQLVLFYLVVTKKIKFTLRHIVFGWILGVANFGNILFYIKAHQALSTSPSMVFSAMNIGVIVAGALIGLVIFKEKLSIVNKLGIVLAIAAIAVITISQLS
jgi:drug/metabolite transporter (DMT)-like permease